MDVKAVSLLCKKILLNERILTDKVNLTRMKSELINERDEETSSLRNLFSERGCIGVSIFKR